MAEVTEPDVDVTTGEIIDEDTRSATTPGTDVVSSVAALRAGGSDIYSTIEANTFAERLALGSAVNAAKRIDENLGIKFNLANYIIQVVTINSDAGLTQAPRVTLISDDGTAYVGTSVGLLNAIKSLEAAVGAPSSWEGNSVPVEIVEEGVRPRKYFTIKY